MLLVSIWVYVIVALIVRQSAQINVALCREQIARRRWSIAGAWLAVASGVALIVVGIANAQPGNFAWIAVLGLIVLLAGAIVGTVLARLVVPTRITKEHIWLKGVHPAFLAALPEFQGVD